MDLTIAISFAAFLGCLAGIAGLGLYVAEHRRISRWRRRVERTKKIEDGFSFLASLWNRVRRLLLLCGRWRAGSTREGEPIPLPNPFATAGLHSPDSPVLFQGAKLIGAVACPLTCLLLYGLLTSTPAFVPLAFCAATAFGGWYAPDVWLQRRIERRQRNILSAFPDALDLMVVCVEAGLSLDVAITRVGQELKLMHRALSEELRALSLELRTGRSRQQALRNAGLRMQLEEVRSFVALLVQTERFGTSVGQALRVHADGLRIRQDFQATEVAAKLPVKMLLPLIFFIFPSLLVVLLGPAAIQVFRQLAPALTP